MLQNEHIRLHGVHKECERGIRPPLGRVCIEKTEQCGTQIRRTRFDADSWFSFPQHLLTIRDERVEPELPLGYLSGCLDIEILDSGQGPWMLQSE